MKIVSTTLMIGCLFVWTSPLRAQSVRSLLYDGAPAPLIQGERGREDLSTQPAPAEDYGEPSAGVKSPRKAFLFSLLVPGAGEAYAGAIKRGLGFFCLELLSVGLYAAWDGKGDDLEGEFRAFADEIMEDGRPRWDREEYERWRDSAFTYGDTTHTLPFRKREEMEKYQEMFPERYADAEVDAQQFYELIGKYHQFVFGWNDRSSDTFSDTTYTVTSEAREGYEDKRAESNRYLKRAKYALGVMLFNHVVSAIDAARQARMRNERVAAESSTKVRMVLRDEDGEPMPMLMAWRRF